MNLAKIIADLRLELQCLSTAIASMEELARVQSLSESAVRELAQPNPEPTGDDEPPPVKRRRGRPPKNASQADSPEGHAAPQPAPSAPPPGDGDATASAA
jgi:hypothetical protein